MNEIKIIGTALKSPKAFSENGPAQFMVKSERTGTKAFDFLPIKAFGDLKTLALENIVEGSEIEIIGSLQSGSYEKEGKKVYTLDVIATSISKHEPQIERKGW